MENNGESKKNNFTTYCLIIAIIIIALMGIKIYNLSKTKSEDASKVEQMQSTIDSQEAAIDSLQNKMNIIGDTISSALSQVNSSTSESSTNNNYTNSNVCGTYTNNNYTELVLQSNGTFFFETPEQPGSDHSGGFIGTYEIQGNNIILNKTYQTYSDISLTTLSGTITAKISNNKIEFFDNVISNTNCSLTKQSSGDTQDKDYYDVINQAKSANSIN